MDCMSQSLEFTYLINKDILSSNWAGPWAYLNLKTWLIFPKGLVVGWGMVMVFGFDLMLLLLKPSESNGFFGGSSEELSQPILSLFQEIFRGFFLKENNA